MRSHAESASRFSTPTHTAQALARSCGPRCCASLGWGLRAFRRHACGCPAPPALDGPGFEVRPAADQLQVGYNPVRRWRKASLTAERKVQRAGPDVEKPSHLLGFHDPRVIDHGIEQVGVGNQKPLEGDVQVDFQQVGVCARNRGLPSRLSPGPSKAGGAGHPQACMRKARSPQPSDAQHRGPRQRARAWAEWVGAVDREAGSAQLGVPAHSAYGFFTYPCRSEGTGHDRSGDSSYRL
ncbi:hypothetical protein METESE_35730 [Mesoterricola sediminis]|uniref:Uncharacterized protein n=1 Tax=Mesoterricola sediminis TaxID=2927980 RepID=A0AA48H264_9BACT|nr:hypothetical protein METESE_35730 [Mesoterricola sediminis]